MKNYTILMVIIGLITLSQCTQDPIFENENPYDEVDQYLTYIDRLPQREGDASVGKVYLKNGNYVSSGIPADLFSAVFPQGNNELNRNGKNENIPFEYTQITHSNGLEVVAPNCMQCHAGYVDGEFVLGVANLDADFTVNNDVIANLVDFQLKSTYGEESPEYESFEAFGRAVKATGEFLVTETVGSNSADKLALILGAHRDKSTLEWLDEPQYQIPVEVIPADVPAWWLLKKKNAMFSTGIGRGDFARIMMASSVLTLTDTSEARIIDEEFINVASFIKSIEAPKYTGSIDAEKAERGKKLFEATCSKCHGRYSDEKDSYPNVIVDHELLETDPLLAQSNFAYKEFADWYNTSWFSKGDAKGSIVPGDGYLAPPLDGVWATAPYLHNGSIPNLESLLDSSKRPIYWRRSAGVINYDHEKMGIEIEVMNSKVDKYTFDTTIPGYCNQVHYFGDFMTAIELSELLEYLKTL